MRFPPDWTPEDQQEWLEGYAENWEERHKPIDEALEGFGDAFEKVQKILRTEGEPVKKVISILQAWYELMEGGLSDAVAPDLDDSQLLFTKEEVDHIIEVVDGEFEKELRNCTLYWEETMGITEPPRFSRLNGKARLAFAQDLWVVLHDAILPDITFPFAESQ